MKRKMFELTERQLKKCSTVEMPSDDELKQRWAKAHHGKIAGWGLEKRNFILHSMTKTAEYQRGLWQGRTDKARGLDYQHETLTDDNVSAYNLGYYRGYTDWTIGGYNGFDRPTLDWFIKTYVEA
jgi:hypothetical protein